MLAFGKKWPCCPRDEPSASLDPKKTMLVVVYSFEIASELVYLLPCKKYIDHFFSRPIETLHFHFSGPSVGSNACDSESLALLLDCSTGDRGLGLEANARTSSPNPSDGHFKPYRKVENNNDGLFSGYRAHSAATARL